MRTNELIHEAISLPVDERALVVDCLLKSLNTPEAEVDRQWAEEARSRLADLRSGKVAALPGEDVFRRLLKRIDQ